MFVSPKRTREIRKEGALLEGNLFAEKKLQLHPAVYKSLLETLVMRPKKKHFKKIVEYIRTYEEP